MIFNCLFVHKDFTLFDFIFKSRIQAIVILSIFNQTLFVALKDLSSKYLPIRLILKSLIHCASSLISSLRS